MRILYLAARECWPLTTGARLRDYHLARQLASRCSLTYVGLHNPEEPAPEGPPRDSVFFDYVILPRNRSYSPSTLLRGLIGPTPVTILNYSASGARRELAGILTRGNYDSVQMEGVHLMSYLPVIRAAINRPAVIVDWHNVESDLLRRYAASAAGLARRMAARRTTQLLEGAEDRLLAACPVHTVTSANDRQRLAARKPDAQIHVVPNGVDTGYHSEAEMSRFGGTDRNSVLFVGSMDYHANIDAVVWFVREVWPHVHAKYPGVCFKIVGRSPSAEVRALISESVEVTGTVEDVRPFYAGALAAVIPLRVAGGTRLKILEAMAAGVPVISTRLGAEGLDVEDGRSIMLADTAGELVSAVSRLVSSGETRKGLSEAGRLLVTEKYDWSIVGEQLFRIHDSAADPRTKAHTPSHRPSS